MLVVLGLGVRRHGGGLAFGSLGVILLVPVMVVASSMPPMIGSAVLPSAC
jgi:hypothetical protein